MARKLPCAFKFLQPLRPHYSFRYLCSSHTFPELFFGAKKPSIQSPRRRRLGPYEFLSFLKLEKDPDRLVSIWKEASEHHRFHHHRSAYESTVKKLATANRPDAVEEILEHEKQLSRSRPYNEGFIVRIITLYGRAGMPDQAVKTFRQCPDFDCGHSVKCFNAALCALYAAKQHQRILDLYSEIKETLNIKPNLTTFLTVIKALCQVGSSNSGYSMLDEMVKHGCSPDTVTFNVVLKGFYNEGKTQEAARVLKKMSEMGCHPDVHTYNIRILNLCNESKSHEAKALLRVMRADGIKPNTLSYNTLIEGFCKEHNLVEANKVFVGDGNEFDPNNQSYYTFIYYLCIEEEFDWALEVCDESIRKNWVPNISVLQMLIEGLVKISKVDSACRIIGEARSRFPFRCVGLWDDIEKALSEVSGARRVNSSGK